jgi:hypothetical protein
MNKKEKKGEYQKNWVEKNKEEYTAYQKEYHAKRREEKRAEKAIIKAEYEKNFPPLSKEQKEDLRKLNRKLWIKNNREKITEQQREYTKAKHESDPFTKTRHNVKSRTKSAFKNGFDKSKKTSQLIGCCWEDLRTHIENQFLEGMSWDNNTMHGWHVDHIIPLGSAKTIEDLESLCHYTNLQPLWSQDNWKKGDSIPNGHFNENL